MTPRWAVRDWTSWPPTGFHPRISRHQPAGGSIMLPGHTPQGNTSDDSDDAVGWNDVRDLFADSPWRKN